MNTRHGVGSARHGFWLLLRVCFLVCFPSAVPAANIAYVSPTGSASPGINDPGSPWQIVRAAAMAAPRGEVLISPGWYPEGGIYLTTVVLRAPGGDVRIGITPASQARSTSVGLLCWNTHLFGDVVVGPVAELFGTKILWQDYQRAEEIGRKVGAMAGALDVVGFCEIWDEDLFLGGDGAAGIHPISNNFRHAHHGSRTDRAGGLDPFLNSGLALLSHHAPMDIHQVSFSECEGSLPTDSAQDCRANKGYLTASFSKDGFGFRVYMTHTQAGTFDDAVEARREQILELARDIERFRQARPADVVFLMGDLNVPGETSEYDFLRDAFARVGGRDAARNAAEEFIFHSPRTGHTLTSSNKLALHFDEVPYNERLDYIWYFPSADGNVVVQPEQVRSLQNIRGTSRTEKGFTSDELSDHYPLSARFTLRGR